MRRKPRRSPASAGFTFLEIMLVVAIIGVLASFLAVKIRRRFRPASKEQFALQKMQSLKTALERFEVDGGRLPTTSEGLAALVDRPGDFPEKAWPEDGYLADGAVPRDPWGQPFRYAFPSEHGVGFDLSSAGPDRQHGTADDLINWSAREANKSLTAAVR